MHMTALSAAAYFFISLFIFTRNKKRNLCFFAGMFFIALSELFLVFLRNSGEVGWLRLSTGAELFSLPFWLVFVLTFNQHDKTPGRFKYTALAAIFATVIFAVLLFRVTFFSGAGEMLLIGAAGKYYAFYCILTCSVILWRLEQLYNAVNTALRTRYITFFIGLALLLSTIILKNSIWLAYPVFITGNTSYYSTLLFIAACLTGYASIRHRLLDVDIFVSRYIVYRTVSLLAIGIYLLVVGAAAGWINLIGNNLFFTFLFVLAATVAMTLLYNSSALRYRVKLFINRNFFKYKHDFHDCWMEVIANMPGFKSRGQIKNMIQWLIKSRLRAREVIFWSFDSRHFVYENTPLPLSEEAISMIMERNGVINCKGNWSNLAKGEEALSVSPFYLVAPVKAGDSVLGILTIDANILDEPYNPDDMELVWAIIKQGAANIMNIELTGQLVAARENEVFSHFSSFVIHDLKNFTQTLSLILQNVDKHAGNREFLNDAFKSIGTVVGKMNSITANLATVSGSLCPSFSRVAIGAWLEDCCGDMHYNAITYDLHTPDMYLKIDTSLFERAVHNFIINARESRPEKPVMITVRTAPDNGCAVITFTDDGPGIPAGFIRDNLFRPFRTTKARGLGIGLFECKKIIEAHNGSIGVTSGDAGTTIRITLPYGE